MTSFSLLFICCSLLFSTVHAVTVGGDISDFSFINGDDGSADTIELVNDNLLSRSRRETPTTTPQTLTDNHDYYTKRVAVMHPEAKFFTTEFDRIFATYPASSHVRLNNGTRLALVVPLKFSFPFYGHTVERIVVTTGGYLYINNISHSYLGFSQYIAPLMADFNTHHPNSTIKYIDAEDSFWARWENVQLNTNASSGDFSFQCALFKNGSIVFDYISVPSNLVELEKTENYVVKAGLSDAYYWDTRISSTQVRRLIVRYHTVNIDLSLITKDTVVNFTHLTTCNQLSSCNQCLNRTLVKGFSCSWCFELNSCSSGIDRQLQNWRNAGCHVASDDTCRPPSSSMGVVVAVLVVVILLALSACIAAFIIFAYRNPNSSAGRWLIEHRPSQLRSRLANVRFFRSSEAGSASAGDDYKVDVDHTYANMEA